jgi:hypothetical protein
MIDMKKHLAFNKRNVVRYQLKEPYEKKYIQYLLRRYGLKRARGFSNHAM